MKTVKQLLETKGSTKKVKPIKYKKKKTQKSVSHEKKHTKGESPIWHTGVYNLIARVISNGIKKGVKHLAKKV